MRFKTGLLEYVQIQQAEARTERARKQAEARTERARKQAEARPERARKQAARKPERASALVVFSLATFYQKYKKALLFWSRLY
jgi:F0F1-type ATP synthase membrane subunit b/b'